MWVIASQHSTDSISKAVGGSSAWKHRKMRKFVNAATNTIYKVYLCFSCGLKTAWHIFLSA